MKEVYYTYNNEAIASCVMLQVLHEVKTIDIARSCLILPFLLDDRTVVYLQKNIDREFSLEDFIYTQPRLFASFNKRYLALLPVFINSVLLLNRSNQVDVASEISIINPVAIANNDLGERFNTINEALPILLKIIRPYSTVQLYQLLKIQL